MGHRAVRGAAVDSRLVRPGVAFFALPGERTDGHRFLADAISAGAAALVVSDRLAAADSPAALESAEFAFDAARAALHASEEKLLQRLLESRREALAELGATG